MESKNHNEFISEVSYVGQGQFHMTLHSMAH